MAEPAALDQPVFSIDDRAYTWRDVVAYARFLGIWDEIEERAALVEQADLDPEAVDAAAMTFRRERGLLAADELDAWLERRGITVDDWLAYVRRSLFPGPVGEVPTSGDVWAEAMCSGRLDELADDLADRLAVAPESSLAELGEAFGAYASRVATDDAIDREIASARVEWIRVRYRAALFADAAAASEVALAVRADGEALTDVAALAGVEVDEVDTWLEDERPALASLFVGSSEGDLLGPLVVDDGLLVTEVLEKIPVDAADPAVRARAAQAIVERAVRREVDKTVVWHES